MSKCKGLDKNNNLCRNSALDNIKFCKFHDYMSNYTEEQMNNLTLCSGCNKQYYLEKLLNCEKCSNRGKIIRIKDKENKILCKFENCTYGKSDTNDYCGKHQGEFFKHQTINSHKKVCTNYIRGCRTQLNLTYNFTRCKECLEKDRIKDKARRNKVPIINNNIIIDNTILNNDKDLLEEIELFEEEIKLFEVKNTNNLKKKINIINDTKLTNNKIELLEVKNIKNIELDNALIMIDEVNNNIDYYEKKINKIIFQINCFKDNTNKQINLIYDNTLHKCSNVKCKLIYPEKYFISDNDSGLTKQCQVCRDKGKEKDHRETRLESKQIWKEENHDKMAKYTLDHRGRKMEELREEYWENKAEQSKNWRTNNPEKVKENNEKKKQDINQHYKNYQRVAKDKNLNFNLTLDYFIELVKKPCFYCNLIQDKGFNGIDRKDCTKGYIEEFCVSCCEICNFIKGSLNDEVFIKRVEHILTYQNYIKGNLYPETFGNHISSNFNSYKKRANEKEIDFELNEEIFYNIIQHDCYICGKSFSDNHTNGIDRIDNTKGYILPNIESCCAECNYMKSDLSLEDFFDKLRKIRKNKLSNYEIINSTFKYFNKLKQRNFVTNKINNSSIESVREYERIKKQKQRNKINIQDKNEIINNTLKGHLNKKTEEEKREEARLRKQKSRELLRQKYGDEEYKRRKALELAEYRKKIRNQQN